MRRQAPPAPRVEAAGSQVTETGAGVGSFGNGRRFSLAVVGMALRKRQG